MPTPQTLALAPDELQQPRHPRPQLLQSANGGGSLASDPSSSDSRFGTPPATPTDTATAARPPWRSSTLAAPTWRSPSTVSHELLRSKHKSSSLAGTARTAASGQNQQPAPRCPF